MPIHNSRTLQVFQDSCETLVNNSQPCCIDRLKLRSTQHCEGSTYLPGPCDGRLLRFGNVSVAARKKSFRPRKRRKYSETPKHLSTSMSVQNQARNLLNTLMLRYLRKVHRICGKVLRDMPNYLPFILSCDWNFSPRVNIWRSTDLDESIV